MTDDVFSLDAPAWSLGCGALSQDSPIPEPSDSLGFASEDSAIRDQSRLHQVHEVQPSSNCLLPAAELCGQSWCVTRLEDPEHKSGDIFGYLASGWTP